ncbi:LOW QUALITY PROTEIN: hypothetical protein OSB04_011504 [Centaurea solstitialis]|uniref:Reverse transcriptase Ty1/copia-type domain-containing protein n=1 Tax=Centaurea solstitialis TaxID=347529 RepID=A0AA38T9J5_9ASTR|nr:LOW QUALITY PROTEIN: hypothetical protein OSB04_011504 [Centaurea solstitialis]
MILNRIPHKKVIKHHMNFEHLFTEWYDDDEQEATTSSAATTEPLWNPFTTKVQSTQDQPSISHSTVDASPIPEAAISELVVKGHKWTKSHPQSQITEDPSEGVQTKELQIFVSFHVFELEPKKLEEALLDPYWVEAMQDELLQFERNHVWTLVLQPKRQKAISTKWVFKNKKDEDGVVIRNKVRLVAKGYDQK